ncbi:hypothetical protein [Burkholderia sp. MSMB1835]|uniref:hypothetical protein n=1 Tax=Burkholderia sp. MSMB1835 TaxID=1637876 RepID=UPI0012E33A11|nr:hypothetical protein [Burkholderia sp. MSMB1835]
MNNEQMAKFLAQFEASKKDVAQWPAWMKNVAVASLPESKTSETKSSPDKEVRPKA